MTAGADIGDGSQFEAEPDKWIRLTLGPRKRGDRWVVTHEHHSFCVTD